jgi:K+-transporting ATPase ATPase C chain
LLRERVARQLGPIARYRSGDKKGQAVGPDVESWFKQDQFGGKPGIVAQWAGLHSSVATNWVKADPLNTAYVAQWQKSHPDEVAQWKKDNPDAGDPKPEDLAGPFFVRYSKDHPATFPSAVEHKADDGKSTKQIEPVSEGSDIQGIFFDMWLQQYPKVDLEPVPADMVMASGSGLDPHISLDNALYQLDRVAAKVAEKTKRDVKQVRTDIEHLLNEKTEAPLRGAVGVPLVNVLEINLALRERYGA